MIILPRQARDEHRENTLNQDSFSAGDADVRRFLAPDLHERYCAAAQIGRRRAETDYGSEEDTRREVCGTQARENESFHAGPRGSG